METVALLGGRRRWLAIALRLGRRWTAGFAIGQHSGKSPSGGADDGGDWRCDREMATSPIGSAASGAWFSDLSASLSPTFFFSCLKAAFGCCYVAARARPGLAQFGQTWAI
nr:hypothetical protein Iba_chr09cCG12020 [Ipomoea batatas]GME20194.1 hypothetical protein Iba_scaffold24475CG0020 [Ipomoea batatas]